MFGIFRSRALAAQIEDLDDIEDMTDKPWPERPHNAELQAVVKDVDKISAVEAADAQSKEVYDGIDEHVSELQRFRERLRKRRKK